jgi:hypothetical protein
MTRDPFRCDGPTIINVSGGRTSALMLRRILDAHDGALPDDVHAVFCNTGLEREETLAFLGACEAQWGANIRWIERDSTRAPRERWREVTHATASRRGEPFAQAITEKMFLPNAVMRFCTQMLKIEPSRAFMVAQGYEHWTSVVGLRRDEPSRVSKVRSNTPPQWDVGVPLYDARVTVADVDAFWRASPFTLALKSYESNCAGCMLKPASVLVRLERDAPGALEWWHQQERAIGARFHKGRTYLDLINEARSPALPGVFDDQPALPCACTD